MHIIESTLNKITIGHPVIHRNLAMYPLLGGDTAKPDYLTLNQAHEAGVARVTEISEGASVPELTFENLGDAPVLLLDGEELIGAKQNRMLNLSILVPAKQTITIPVSCVEAGRWSYVSSEFSASGRAQYSRLRASKMAHVSESLRRAGSRRSNQSAVWDDIHHKMDSMGVHSLTGSADEMYLHHHDDVEDYVATIEHARRQCGAVFTIDGRVIGLDMFGNVETMHQVLPMLVRSYAMDAIGGQHAGPIPAHAAEHVVDIAMIERILADVAHARTETFNAIGLGEDIRLTGSLCQGAALCHGHQLVHLCAFMTSANTATESQGTMTRYASVSQRRRRFH